MKRTTFIILFIVAHIIFVIAHIDKSNRYIKACYEKQEYEKEKEHLITEKQKLQQKLCELKKPSHIKKIAKHMGMRKIKLNRVKKLTVNG